MVEDREALELTESIEEAERLFIDDFDTWDMTGYYLYSKLWRSGVSRHIGTGGIRFKSSVERSGCTPNSLCGGGQRGNGRAQRSDRDQRANGSGGGKG